jgi:molecular chaperone DnaK
MRAPLEQAIKDAGLTPQGIDKIILIGGPTRMPIVQKFVEDYIGKQVEHGVDPMEAVAKGAAVQAGVLGGEVGGKEILLLDVTPLTLGLETLGGVRTPLIDRNTTIPTSKSQVFSTAADNQTQVQIHVLQGEREFAVDNKSLGTFNLDGLPPAPRGVPQVEVTFDIDASGILKVTAKDKGTGKDAHITIQGSTNLSKEDVERMKQEAEQHASEDRKRRETVDVRNEADTLIAVSEKTLADSGDKVNPDDKTAVETALKELKEVKDKDDVEAIRAKVQALSSVIQKVGAAMYEAGTQQPGDAGTVDPKEKEIPSEEGTVDAEFKEVPKDENKS